MVGFILKKYTKITMIARQLLDDYFDNKCIGVWKEISFIDYYSLNDNEREIVKMIINETLHRVNYNVTLVINVLSKYGFEYKNFGNLNSINKAYQLEDPEIFERKVFNLFENPNLDKRPPLFFASFYSFFKVIDLRGDFNAFEVDFLLDPFFLNP